MLRYTHSILLSTMLAMITINPIYCNQLIDGLYKSDKANLKIENGKFCLLIPKNQITNYATDTVAFGRIDILANDLIELNSFENPISTIVKHTVIISKQPILNTDSVKIKFIIPYTRDDLVVNIEICDDFLVNQPSFSFTYSQMNQEIIIPMKTEKISIWFKVMKLPPSLKKDFFHGNVEYVSFVEYVIDSNNVEISIPTLKDYSFERYYIVGDYARLTSNGILWKGDLYIKEDSKILQH